MPKIVQEGSVGERRSQNSEKKGSVWDRVKPVSLGNKKDSVLVYGNSGTGKTTFACTYPKPLLLIGFEDGTRSVHNLEGVHFIRARNSQDVRDLIEGVKQGSADLDYQTVVIDTVTEMQDMVLKEVMGVDELPAQKSFGMATRSDYGDCALKTKEILREVLKLPEESICNCIILGQERTYNTDSDSGTSLEPYVCVALTPSVAGFLNPAVDYNLRSFIKQKEDIKQVKVNGKVKTIRKTLDQPEYCLRIKAHSVYTIKFRAPKGTPLPDYIPDPNYGKVRELIEGK